MVVTNGGVVGGRSKAGSWVLGPARLGGTRAGRSLVDGSGTGLTESVSVSDTSGLEVRIKLHLDREDGNLRVDRGICGHRSGRGRHQRLHRQQQDRCCGGGHRGQHLHRRVGEIR